jgi:hypothetical protein
MLTIIQRFDKHCSCHFQGENGIVRRFWKPYIGQAVLMLISKVSIVNQSQSSSSLTWLNSGSTQRFFSSPWRLAWLYIPRTHPPVQWAPGALHPGVKQPKLEADYSRPLNTVLKNALSFTSTPQASFYRLFWTNFMAVGFLWKFDTYSIYCVYGTQIFITTKTQY